MEKKLIDINKLIEEFGGLEDAREILEVFISDIPNVFENLKDAWESKNYEKMYLQAHKLKGSTQSMGMKNCSQLLDSLESEAKEKGNSEKINHLISKIDIELGTALDQVQDFLSKN